MMTSPNPRAAAEQLVRQASTDQTGQALPSLKGSLIEELMLRSRCQSTLTGRTVLRVFRKSSRSVLAINRGRSAMNGNPPISLKRWTAPMLFGDISRPLFRS